MKDTGWTFRIQRASQLIGLLIVSWCVMLSVHECGHMLCGWSCGGSLQSFDLAPWRLPYSFFEPDPQPLITLWGGPILGALIPMIVASALKRDWAWFIAYFCVLANGTYLATAWLSGDRYLDTPKLLEHGAHPASIVLFCLLTIGIGYIGFRRLCVRMLTPKRMVDNSGVGDTTPES